MADPADALVAADAARGSDPPSGLTSAQARRRLEEFGPNAMPDTAASRWRMALGKFWAPVPWMLELAIVFQVGLGEYGPAAVIAVLLVFNGVLGFLQEGRAQATLDALKARLALTAAVRRDGTWRSVPAAELVPGDIVKLSLGHVVAADMRLIEGDVLLDQSMLTGESLPIEGGPGQETYAGHWYAGAKRLPRSPRPAFARNSAAPPNWCAPRMSRAGSKRQCCGWCATWRYSTSRSSSCRWPMPGCST